MNIPRSKNIKLHTIIGQSQVVRELLKTVALVAKSRANVLIFGETGTGKELVARSIHQHSARKDTGFVPLDCVALPPHLIESELFGYEKGAFTGAVSDKRGLLEYADQGTLFLDEISALDINLQAKLLRVLQEREFRRLGGKTLITVDLRVISAMNCSPDKAVTGGTLRQDLYYRLNVIPIYVPPLRQRVEDIPLLVRHFLKGTIDGNGTPEKTVSSTAMEHLQKYPWPGNVRELQNLIERLSLLTHGPLIDVQHLPPQIRLVNKQNYTSIFNMPYNQAKKQHLELFKEQYFQKLLQETGRDITKAARIAGVSERTIYRMLERYGK